jgi:hypothetical protein
MSEEDDLDDLDRAALVRALQLMLTEPESVDQFNQMLKEDGWMRTAMVAAYNQQCDALHLKPWEIPPCQAYPDTANDPIRKGAWHLLCRMAEHGISRYGPDPLGAIAKAEKSAKATA